MSAMISDRKNPKHQTAHDVPIPPCPPLSAEQTNKACEPGEDIWPWKFQPKQLQLGKGKQNLMESGRRL